MHARKDTRFPQQADRTSRSACFLFVVRIRGLMAATRFAAALFPGRFRALPAGSGPAPSRATARRPSCRGSAVERALRRRCHFSRARDMAPMNEVARPCGQVPEDPPSDPIHEPEGDNHEDPNQHQGRRRALLRRQGTLRPTKTGRTHEGAVPTRRPIGLPGRPASFRGLPSGSNAGDRPAAGLLPAGSGSCWRTPGGPVSLARPAHR